RELHAEDVDPRRAPESIDESDEKRIGASQPPVRRADRRRTHANEHFMLSRNGLFDIPDFDDLRRAIPVVDGRFHRRARSVCALTMLSLAGTSIEDVRLHRANARRTYVAQIGRAYVVAILGVHLLKRSPVAGTQHGRPPRLGRGY